MTIELSKPSEEIKLLYEEAVQKEINGTLTLFMRGYSPNEISELLNITHDRVKECLRLGRKQLSEWYKDEIDALRAERVHGFRQIMKRAQDEYDVTPNTNQNIKTQLLNLMFKVEDSLAKIQGVTQETIKHTGNVEHAVKLYDFNSGSFPEAKQVIIDVNK